PSATCASRISSSTCPDPLYGDAAAPPAATTLAPASGAAAAPGAPAVREPCVGSQNQRFRLHLLNPQGCPARPGRVSMYRNKIRRSLQTRNVRANEAPVLLQEAPVKHRVLPRATSRALLGIALAALLPACDEFRALPYSNGRLYGTVRL